MSDDTLLKQAVSRTGQDFGLAEYWRVQPTIESALAILRDQKPSGTLVYLIYGEADDLYVAVVKPATNPVTGEQEIFIDSFRRSNERELARARQRFEVIK
ncbi:MAG TPA: hypothetical protein VFN13_09925 [Rudaea sp.]|nr:hypothetical protein [Rudaea sp.]